MELTHPLVAPRPPSTAAVRDVRVHAHIDDVKSAEWDAILDASDVQLSHRFVKTCQDAGIEHAEYRHVLIYDADGLACIATLSFMHVSLELLSSRRWRGPVQAIRRLYPSFLRVPVLFCGLPVSFGRPCVRVRPGADRVSCVTTLCEVMTRAADELGATICCFKEFDDDEAEQVEVVQRLGYFRAASLPSCRLAIRWSSFEEYLGSMRAGYRRQVRGAWRVGHRAGLELITVDDFAPYCRRIVDLYAQVMDRAEFQLERLNARFFDLLARNFPGQCRAILARRRGEVVAAAILLEGGGTCAFLLAGIDYASNRSSEAYVNLVTETVAHAIRTGAAALEMGQTSYDIKRRVGAQPSRRHLFVRHRAGLGHRLLQAAGEIVFPAREYPPRRVFRRE